MEQKKPAYKKGISIDASPTQWVVVVVMFMILFVLPIVIQQFYLSTKVDDTIDETYTEAALDQNTETDGDGQVAGISTTTEATTAKNYVKVPVINYQFDTDLSNPASIAVLVGTIFGLLSIVLFFNIFFDFFRG